MALAIHQFPVYRDKNAIKLNSWEHPTAINWGASSSETTNCLDKHSSKKQIH